MLQGWFEVPLKKFCFIIQVYAVHNIKAYGKNVENMMGVYNTNIILCFAFTDLQCASAVPTQWPFCIPVTT